MDTINLASRAKLAPPWMERVYPRSRLFELLDRPGVNPLTWIYGPPGAGKTTLAAGYLQHGAADYLWVNLDRHDAEPATLLHYLAAGARPRAHTDLPRFSAENSADAGTFARHFFESLWRGRDQPLILVFDNYQELPQSAPSQQILAENLSELPPGCRALLLSREPPPPVYARAQIEGRLAVVPPETLVLDADEQQAIIALREPGGLAPQTENYIVERSAGWAAGLVLLLENPEQLDTQSANTGPPLHVGFFNIFLAELCGQLPHQQRRALVACAQLPEMTAKMAQDQTRSEAAAALLARLAEKHLFVQRHGEAEAVFRFHPLFREYLLQRANDYFSAHELAELKARAAAILLQADAVSDAARLLCELEDWPALDELICRFAQARLVQGRAREVLSWLQAIPGDLREQSARLMFWEARCQAFYTPQTALRRFADAYRRFRAEADVEGAIRACCGAVDTCLAGRSDLHPLDDWIEAHRQLDAHRHDLPDDLQLQLAQSRLAALTYRRPKDPELPRLAAWLKRHLQSHAAQRDSLRAAAMMMLYYAVSGQMENCRLLSDSLLPSLSRRPASPLDQILACHVQAVVYWLEGDSSAALEAARRGLGLAENSGVSAFTNALHAHAGHALLVLGRIDEAGAELQCVNSRLDPAQSFDNWYYHHLAGWMAVLRDDPAAAREHADLSLLHARRAGIAFTEITAHMASCVCAWERGDKPEAWAHLAEARRMSRDGGYPHGDFMVHLGEARFLFEEGDTEDALRALARGLEASRRSGHVRLTWWRGDDQARLYARALEAGIDDDQVSRIIRRLGLTPHAAIRHPENWPMPFKALTLGGFEISQHETTLRFTGKAQRRPLELLKIVIAMGGKDVPAHKITDILWPDTDGDGAYRSLVTTLSRLRKLLEVTEAVRLDGAHISLDPRYWWLDVWTFEDLFDQAHAMARLDPPQLNRDTLIQQRRKLLRIYRGAFLDGESEEAWALSARERLRSRFLRQIHWHAGAWLSLQDEEQALECYRRAIDAAPEAEENYRRLISLCLETGRVAEGLAAYRTCKQQILNYWKVPPSEPTERLYQALAAKGGLSIE